MRFLVGKHKIEGNFQSGGSLGWNYGTEPKEVLINKVFHLGHYENIKKIGKLSIPFWKLLNCVRQNILLGITRIAQSWSRNGKKTILIIQEIFQNYYSIELRKRIKISRTVFKIPHECSIKYCFCLDFSSLFLWCIKAGCDIS